MYVICVIHLPSSGALRSHNCYCDYSESSLMIVEGVLKGEELHVPFLDEIRSDTDLHLLCTF